MKTIMFNDRYNLTAAVLSGRKTQTRRNSCRYKVGEVVAIAQSYKDCVDECIRETGLPVKIKPNLKKEAGYKDKRFVKADLMPDHIRITAMRQERLQDISDEDCMKEGIIKVNKYPPIRYVYKRSINQDGDILSSHWYSTPREAFAALIDRVSGRGTWESNPMVYVYDFELVD